MATSLHQGTTPQSEYIAPKSHPGFSLLSRFSNDSNWFVIDSSTVEGSGSTYLGRPWRDWARFVPLVLW